MRSAFGFDFDVPDFYLNTASIGIPAAPVADAVMEAMQGWRSGAGRPKDFDKPVAEARAAYARLIGVTEDSVATGGSVSELVGLVAGSLPDRSRVLVARGDFTSVTWPFAAQAGRGVSVTEVELDELAQRAGDADLVAVSVVQSADGRLADLDALRAAQATGTRIMLDATQATGWLDHDLGWADIVVGCGYKWLFSPRGAAWMAVRPDFELVPNNAAWSAGEDVWSSIYGLPLRLASSARAFDTSPAWYCHVGASVALPLLGGLDRAAVQAHCVGLADAFLAGLGLPPQGSAIVSVTLPDAGARLDAAGVVTAQRGNGTRLSFHLYNTDADVARALNALT
jgi:selenocysteine lyase/cysteine desulfurase